MSSKLGSGVGVSRWHVGQRDGRVVSERRGRQRVEGHQAKPGTVIRKLWTADELPIGASCRSGGT